MTCYRCYISSNYCYKTWLHVMRTEGLLNIFETTLPLADLHFCFILFYATTGLWGLVNNAGILKTLPIEWTPLNTFKRIADVNLWGMIDVTKTFLPLVKKARGRVVNFSSGTGKYLQQQQKKENGFFFLFCLFVCLLRQ